ncbi:MAG: FAD-dependent oxidoreductase [Planctomycetota bacterium]|nr:FAD-dependent oxidoreductase [Planctomycetota bacterium]
MPEKWKSVFEQIYDVIIFGAGYAGFAAALCLRKKGKKVLLVERDAGLVWESSRAFPRTWARAMTRCGASGFIAWRAKTPVGRAWRRARQRKSRPRSLFRR